MKTSDKLYLASQLFDIHSRQAATERAKFRLSELKPHLEKIARAHIEANDIDGSHLLTPAGRTDARAKLAQRLAKEHREVKERIGKADAAMRDAVLARARAATPAPLTDAENLRRVTRHAVSWQQLANLSASEVELVYRNTPALREAIEAMPPRIVSDPARGVFAHAEPAISAETVREVHANDLREKNPEIVGDLDDCEATAAMSQALLGTIEQALDELSPGATAEPPQFAAR